tara:strand:- start:736 stop:837 length:102 start_codon:yes stop_codon:yes gene_type:complete
MGVWPFQEEAAGAAAGAGGYSPGELAAPEGQDV